MFNATLEFDGVDKILDNHGLGPGGVGQNFVDNEVILFSIGIFKILFIRRFTDILGLLETARLYCSSAL